MKSAMQFQVCNELHKAEFNRFVANHSSGSFLQSWEWGQWQEQLGSKTIRIIGTEQNDIIFAAQIIQTVIPRLKKYYLYIPYGPLAPKSNDRDGREYLTEFLAFLERQFPEAIFIRLEPKDQTNITGKTTVHIQPGKTLILDLERSTDELLAQMHPKTRYNIKVSEKHNVQVISEPIITPGYGLHLPEIVDLLTDTARRQDFKSHSPAYYKRLIDFFAMQTQSDCTVAIYKALYERKLLATAIMIDFGTVRTYLFGGTSGDQKNVMAPYALHWQAIRDAKNAGLKSYDFWGIQTAKGEAPGFVQFKLRWGGTQVQYPATIDVIKHALWYNIYAVLRNLNRKF
jgi:lipid II:glycine glycyltransferase (peptidoglycan interpeptide bridge formation enzyme)